MNAPDKAFLNKEYNNRELVPDHPQYFARWQESSAIARSRMTCHLDLRYGDMPGEALDLFPARKGDGSCLMFIHGGYWRSLDKSDFSFLAPSLVDAGISLAVSELRPVPEGHDRRDRARRCCARAAGCGCTPRITAWTRTGSTWAGTRPGADERRALDAELVEQLDDRVDVALDRHRPAIRLRRPKPGRSGAITRCASASAGMFATSCASCRRGRAAGRARARRRRRRRERSRGRADVLRSRSALRRGAGRARFPPARRRRGLVQLGERFLEVLGEAAPSGTTSGSVLTAMKSVPL